MKKISFILSVMFLFSSVFFVSCREEKEEVIEFDESYPLALAPDVVWAVVSEPYAAYKKEAAWNADIAGHCRKGEILQVVGKSEVNNEIWYYFENGWLSENSIEIYSNRFKAKAVAGKMTEK